MKIDLSILTPDEREEYEERAAIMEFDGRMPRNEAEHLAYELIIRDKPWTLDHTNTQQ